MDIRDATEADIPDIQAIYAHHVLHGTGTFEEAPPSVEEMAERFATVTGRDWAWLVAADATNLKVTWPIDLQLAALILGQRKDTA